MSQREAEGLLGHQTQPPSAKQNNETNKTLKRCLLSEHCLCEALSLGSWEGEEQKQCVIMN